MIGAPRFIVADPGLTGPEGHHLHYSVGVAEAVQSRGMTAVVLAGRAFSGTIADGRIACEPCFVARYQTSGDGGWPRRVLFSAASRVPGRFPAAVAALARCIRRRLRRRGTPDDPFGRELTGALDRLGATGRDIALLHSVSAANLASLPAALPPARLGHLLIVLRRTPEDMDTDDPGPAPIGALLRRLGETYGAKLVLYADTEPLVRAFRDLVDLPVHAVPPPVAVPPLIARPVRDQPRHLVFIGGARPEKNYHLLPAIAAACRGRARLTLHAGVIDAASDPLLQRAHRQLRRMAGPDLSLIERPLAPPEYWALLESADLVLLPYDSAAYGPRSSGTLVEALAIGVPALVPSGCWMEQAGGVGRTVTMHGPADARGSVRRALAALPELSRAAQTGAAAWREMHSSQALVSALLAPLPPEIGNS